MNEEPRTKRNDRPSDGEVFLRRGVTGLALHKGWPGIVRAFDAAPAWAIWIIAIGAAILTFPLGILVLPLVWYMRTQANLQRDADTLWGKDSENAQNFRASRENPQPVLEERQWDLITKPKPTRSQAPTFGRKSNRDQ